MFLSITGRVVPSSLWNNPEEVPEVERRPLQIDSSTGLLTDLLSRRTLLGIARAGLAWPYSQ